MVKLSQQFPSTQKRLTRTERKLQLQKARASAPKQEPLPEGSLTKADIQKRLEEERQKESNLAKEREEAYQQLRANYPEGENIPLGIRRGFNRDWQLREEQQKAVVRTLEDLNRQMKPNSYIAGDKVESYVKSASLERAREYEVEERREAQRIEDREKAKEIQVTQTPIDPEKFLEDLQKVSVRDVKRTEGGFSEVTILGDENRTVQVVRSKDTGDVRIVELEGKNKGTVLTGKGLSDKEIAEEQNRLIKERQKELEEYEKIDIEKIEPVKQSGRFGAFMDKISPLVEFNKYIRGKRGSAFSKVGELKIPVVTGTTGGSITLKEAGGSIFTGISKGAGFVMDKTFVGDINIPVVAGTTGGQIKVREITPVLKEKISEKQFELTVSQIENLGIKEEYEPVFAEEYQVEFEKKYGEALARDEITFEEAQEKFKTSKEAKKVQERYEKAIEKRKGGVITKETFGLVGLSLANVGVKLVPETYGELAVETALVYGGVKASSLIPPKLSTGLYAGFGLEGASTFLDPTESGEKRVIGGAVALSSATILGIKTLKYLRTPTIKQVEIAPPKINLKTQTVIGKEGKIYQLTKGGEIIRVDKTLFTNQKLSQIGFAGRRTIVSTKWRDILAQFYRNIGVSERSINTGFSAPIYSGVPTAQGGVTTTYSSLRGTYTIKSLTDYEKALNLLSKSNRAYFTVGGETKLISIKSYTLPQLKEILRYQAPRVLNIELEKGLILSGEKGAVGSFKFKISQPVIQVDKALGIKTRGAKSYETIVDLERKLVGKEIVVTGTETRVIKASGIKVSREVILSKVKDLGLKESFLVKKGNIGGIQVSQKIPFEYRDLIERSISRRFYPARARKLLFNQGQTQILKSKLPKDTVTIDFDQTIRKTGSTKTPLSKTFAPEPKTDLNELGRRLRENANKINLQITKDVGGGQQQIQEVVARSRYEGTGLYERTESVASGKIDVTNTLLNTQINPALKTGFVPSPDMIGIKNQIKNLVDFGQVVVPASNLGVSAVAGLRVAPISKTGLRQGFELKDVLRQNADVKTVIKEAEATKTAQTVKTTQALKVSQALTPSLATPKVTFSDIVPPRIPPTTIAFPFGFPTAKQKIAQKINEKKLVQEFAYLPDFTARALGLAPERLTEKQAQKRLKKIQTGFEIRRGVNILKGIPA